MTFFFPGSTFAKETYFGALVGIIQQVCPELSCIIRSQAVARENWSNLLKNNEISPPWLILETLDAYPEDVGRDNIAWRQPVNLYYCASTHDASSMVAGGYDITSWVESRAIDLSTAILSYAGTGFQTIGLFPSHNASQLNEMNRVFLLLQEPYLSSLCFAQLLWGASNCDSHLWT
jgi:hypothetical protein